MIGAGVARAEWETAHKQRMREAMSCFATGVAVVTAAQGGQLHGMTVNSLTSVSLEPPLLLVSLMTEARTTAAILAGERFNLSILDCDGSQICGNFAEQGADHYSRVEYELDAAGVPVVSGCLVDFRCAVEAVHPHADHLIIVGSVLAVRRPNPGAEPLVYFGGRLHRGVEESEAAAPVLIDQTWEWECNSSALSW
jgi:flavin reductase (DIM6/NTAB) family NADH-FMN oxidoreductase RutF